MHQAHLSRRQFITRAAAASGGALAAPYVLPCSVFGASAPSNRINLGFVGVGGRGGGHVGHYLAESEVQILAVCDVDEKRREHQRSNVDNRYAARRPTGSYKGCASYRDFREVVARDDIDAFVVSTPDHWHALVAVAALQAGKDVYCEKPVSLTIAQGQAVVAASRRYGRILQTGSQERSNPGGRYACELIRNGRIGNLKTVYVNLPVGAGDVGLQGPQPVPAELDYDMWLGPAPWAPYTRARVHGSFRYIFDYSGGEMTDRGAHVGDIALWGSSPWLTGPVQIQNVGPREFYTNSLFDTAIKFNIEFTYASGVKIIVSHNGARGIRWEGDEGWIFCAIHGGYLTASNPAILHSVIGPNEIHLHKSPGHHLDFLNAVRTRGPVVAPPEEGHRSATFCHLCNIALILNRKLLWDPVNERFVNDREADRLIWRPMRPPWRL